MTAPPMCVDPPEGWKYGFPKIYDEAKDGELHTWLIKNGYPKEMVEALGDEVCCRFWAVEPE